METLGEVTACSRVINPHAGGDCNRHRDSFNYANLTTNRKEPLDYRCY